MCVRGWCFAVALLFAGVASAVDLNGARHMRHRRQRDAPVQVASDAESLSPEGKKALLDLLLDLSHIVPDTSFGIQKEFPHSHPSNFESHEACLEFAKKLADARDKELETGETKQYEEFCSDYYDHATVGHAPEAAAPMKKPEPKKTAPKKDAAKGHSLTALAFAVVVTAFVY